MNPLYQMMLNNAPNNNAMNLMQKFQQFIDKIERR